MEKVKSKYEIQADKFLEDTGTTFKAELIGNDFYFDHDKDKRDIYRITLTRGDKKWSFRFGQSTSHSRATEGELNRLENKGFMSWSKEYRTLKTKQQAPTAYDVLACVQKYDVGSIDNFAEEFGYQDYKPSEFMKMYAGVVDEYTNVKRMFGDVISKLEEIQ